MGLPELAAVDLDQGAVVHKDAAAVARGGALLDERVRQQQLSAVGDEDGASIASGGAPAQL